MSFKYYKELYQRLNRRLTRKTENVIGKVRGNLFQRKNTGRRDTLFFCCFTLSVMKACAFACL